MTPAIFTFLFLATAPIALMPSVVALFTRHRHRFALLGVNLALWALAFLSIRPLIIKDAAAFPLPAHLGLVGWLALLVWAVKGADAPRSGRHG